MQSPADGCAVPEHREIIDATDALGFERRYKHISKLGDSQKLRHNTWVLCSARTHDAHCLVLDGVNLFTTKTLIEGGIPAWRIHVPNKPDYDAIVAASHSQHGNLYRCSALQWAQALVSLDPTVALEPKPSCCDCSRNPIKTIWLDFTCRWSVHVESTLKLLISPLVMGCGCSHLFLTLNADTRCPHALRAHDAQRFIADVVSRAEGAAVSFSPDHCEEYGNGMFIVRAEVKWSCCEGGVAAAAELYDRLRGEAHAFRKKENSLRAKTN